MISKILGKVYLRSLAAIIGIVAMMIYLKAPDQIPEAMAAIIAVVYIDKKISGDTE